MMSDDRYDVYLEAGEAVVAMAEMTSGDLDPFLFLHDRNDEEVAQNDDRDNTTLNSELVYIAAQGGTFTVIMSNYPDTSGSYRLTISIVPGDEAEVAPRVAMSGEPLSLDTDHFRIHYTLEGSDATTEAYVQQVAHIRGSAHREIDQLGWPAPARRNYHGGTRYDVFLIDLLGIEGEGDGISPEWPSGDNPNTTMVEEYAVPSYLVVDNDYIYDDPLEEHGPPLSLMRATVAHEYHHAIQFGYDMNDQLNWYYESTASWMETITYPDEQDATGYVDGAFNYPEVCFGVEDEADPTDGLLMYGAWLFIQSLADRHGDEAPHRLGQNIALYEGWQPLEETLAHYGEPIPQAVSYYHLQNLVRDYAMTPEFDEYTVWLENTITATGGRSPARYSGACRQLF
jgi:hypothetical protein